MYMSIKSFHWRENLNEFTYSWRRREFDVFDYESTLGFRAAL
jgi:hypothetical protein